MPVTDSSETDFLVTTPLCLSNFPNSEKRDSSVGGHSGWYEAFLGALTAARESNCTVRRGQAR